MAALDDVITTLKNVVTALSSIGNALRRYEGTVTSKTVTGTTLICSGEGYLVNYSVVVTSTTAGMIYDSNSTGTTPAEDAMTITLATTGVHTCGIAFSSGLVVVPGASQSINVTYYQGPL